MSGAYILVAGGAGYIGSHTIVCLLEQGYNVVVVDNLCNSSEISLDRVAEITKLSEEDRKKRLAFHNVNICDEAAMRKVFEASPTFHSCIHFAGLKVRTMQHSILDECSIDFWLILSLLSSSVVLGGRGKHSHSFEILR